MIAADGLVNDKVSHKCQKSYFIKIKRHDQNIFIKKDFLTFFALDRFQLEI